jgi:hypothetical protein
MSNIEQLKIEARNLLEEVNTSGKGNNCSVYGLRSFGEATFKERLNELKQKVFSLQHSASLAGQYNTPL